MFNLSPFQGKTCKKLIADLNSFQKTTFNSLYVTLSRVRARKDMRLMPFNPGSKNGLQHLVKLEPNKDLLLWLKGFGSNKDIPQTWNPEKIKK